MEFPRELNQSAGWTISYSFLEDIRSIIESEHSFYSISLDIIEDVLLAVEHLTKEKDDENIRLF